MSPAPVFPVHKPKDMTDCETARPGSSSCAWGGHHAGGDTTLGMGQAHSPWPRRTAQQELLGHGHPASTGQRGRGTRVTDPRDSCNLLRMGSQNHGVVGAG